MRPWMIILLFPFLLAAQSSDTVSYNCKDQCSRLQVKRLALSSEYAEYSPFVCNDTLIFVSSRPAVTGVSIKDETTGESTTDLFVAARKGSSTGRPKPLSKIINSKYNEGPVSMAGNKLFFSGSEKDPSHKMKLYVSEKKGSSWSEPVMLGFCKDTFSYCHPAASADGKQIYFCANLPGGYGGMDLYSSTWENGDWTAPRNAGPSVNSAADDLFPFLSNEQRLYFSSERSGGKGGLDLYVINLKNKNEKAELLESPINSEHDDFGIWTDSSGASGYLSSNRNKKTKDDIYEFSTVIPNFDKCAAPPVKTQFCYTFYEEAAAETSDTAGTAYEWDFGDGVRSRTIESRHCYNKPGLYKVQLNIIEKSSGKIFNNQVSYDLTIEPPKQLIIACTDTAYCGKPVEFSSAQSGLKNYGLQSFYWHFGDGKYNSGKYVKHTFTTPGIFIVELGVIGINEKTKQPEKFRIEKKIIVKS